MAKKTAKKKTEDLPVKKPWSNTLNVVLFVLVCLLIVLIRLQENEKMQKQSSLTNDLETLDTSIGVFMEKSNPVRLLIPGLNINVSFTKPLGLEEDGEVAVPDTYDEVGWYQYSPTPGELGPAVVLGHVDSYTGPAVFFSLGQLKPGDDIYIDREDGTTAHFQVTNFERYEQVAFPTEKVYGNINYAGLRLITCTGTFNKGEQRYSHNLVVYAKLVE